MKIVSKSEQATFETNYIDNVLRYTKEDGADTLHNTISTDVFAVVLRYDGILVHKKVKKRLTFDYVHWTMSNNGYKVEGKRKPALKIEDREYLWHNDPLSVVLTNKKHIPKWKLR